MKTYRALIGTVVRNASASVKFDEVLYKTAQIHEQKLLEADKRVSEVGVKVAKVAPMKVEKKEAIKAVEKMVKKSK